MNRKMLEQKFKSDEIKQRQGNFGQMLSYIEGHLVVKRLIEATDGEFHFQIENCEFLEEEIIIQGALTINGVKKSQFGSSKITRAKDDNSPISLGDDVKAASTDCLKKCATLFGVGLHLYSDDTDQPEQTEPHSQNINGARLTSKQFNLIIKKGKEAGVNKADINRYCKERFGVVLDHLSRSASSALIDELLNDKIDLAELKNKKAA